MSMDKCPNCGHKLLKISNSSYSCTNCGSLFSNGKETTFSAPNHAFEDSTNIAGTVFGNVSNGSTISGEVKFGATRGHGFAAERANHLYDKMSGRDARIVGDDNAKNGADRLVDGVLIQSKYCKTGSSCVRECFENDKFRYLDSSGKPMQIEVPSDKYDDAIKAMQERIKKGQVPGISDPKEADKIIRKGHFTYEQARNIAKFGTVESLSYDAINGSIVGLSSLAVSGVLSLATSIWNDDTYDVALKKATISGLQVGGTSFATAIVAGQLTKAGITGSLTSITGSLVELMGPKVSATLVNSLRSGVNIYGAAAMNSAQKLLGSNIVTGIASIAVISSVDVVNIFRGRISGAQLFKNLANTAGSVAGGTAGWVGGATAGAAIGSFIPIIGTAIGGIVGGVAGALGGGYAAGKATSALTDEFIEDDADEMVRIIQKEFESVAIDYLINKKEGEQIADLLKEKITGGVLKDMYASSNRRYFANQLIIPCVERITKNRKHINIPTNMELVSTLKSVLS